MNLVISIVDSHSQNFQYSCIPSSVELVLKLSGNLTSGSYPLQAQSQNSSAMTFAHYDNWSHNGATFKKQFSDPRGNSFPLSRLFQEIDSQLRNGRYVIASIGWPGWNYHMWIIYDNANNEYQAVSKWYMQTMLCNSLKTVISGMGGTDILTYT